MSKRKSVVIIVAGIAGLGVVLIGSCAALVYLGYNTTNAAVSPRIDTMFSAIEEGTFARTYDTETTQQLRDVTSREQYEALGDAIAARLGAIKSKRLQGFQFRQVNADSYAEVTYAATFEKANGTIRARLKKEGDKWNFVSFRVESPVFEAN